MANQHSQVIGQQPHAMSHRSAQRRRRGGWRAAVVPVVLALFVGGAGGALAGVVTADADAASTPPELPEAFPDAGQRYLPDLTAGDIQEWITGNDYECEEVAGDRPRGAAHWLNCEAPTSHGTLASVEVEYDDDTQVRSVRARCARGPRTSRQYCPSVFSHTASTVFAGQPDLQKKAEKWGKRHSNNDAATVIGGIQLKMDLADHSLDLVPES